MTAPAETGPSWSRGTNPAPENAAPSPTDMPQATPVPAQAAAEPTNTDSSENGEGDQSSTAESKLRRENAKWRTEFRAEQEARAALEKRISEYEAKSTEADARWNKLASLFNPEAGKPLTVEQLAEQFAGERAKFDESNQELGKKLSDSEAKIRELTISSAIPAVASKTKAHPEGLFKVLTADGVLGKLDPTSATFAADLESAAVAAVEQNPYLKVAQVATRSGAEIPGRSGGTDQLTREQLKGMTPEQINKARESGQLRKLLGG